jgi:superfamily I DNA/RNA helicase
MTMKVSKGLEFPVVALPGVVYTIAPIDDEKRAVRVLYVVATQAMKGWLKGYVGSACLE